MSDNVRLPCNHCGHVVELVSGAEEEEYTQLLMEYRGAYPCYKCDKGMIIMLPSAPRPEKSDERMTAKQFYLAIQGFGSALERMAPKTVLELLVDGTGAAVKSRETEGPSPRLIVEELIMRNGFTLHFAASQYGATVYKVTRDV